MDSIPNTGTSRKTEVTREGMVNLGFEETLKQKIVGRKESVSYQANKTRIAKMSWKSYNLLYFLYSALISV